MKYGGLLISGFWEIILWSVGVSASGKRRVSPVLKTIRSTLSTGAKNILLERLSPFIILVKSVAGIQIYFDFILFAFFVFQDLFRNLLSLKCYRLNQTITLDRGSLSHPAIQFAVDHNHSVAGNVKIPSFLCSGKYSFCFCIIKRILSFKQSALFFQLRSVPIEGYIYSIP